MNALWKTERLLLIKPHLFVYPEGSTAGSIRPCSSFCASVHLYVYEHVDLRPYMPDTSDLYAIVGKFKNR